MGAHGVVGALPGQEGLVEGGELQSAVMEFIKLLGMGALGSLDVAVELGGARRQHEEPATFLPAGLLEAGLELTAAIDLNGAHGKRHAPQQGFQETGRGARGGAAIELHHIPAGDDAAGREVLEDNSGERPYILYLPQRGCCSRRCRTARLNSRLQVGWRTRCGRRVRSSKLSRRRGS